jgi:hypothetical protein
MNAQTLASPNWSTASFGHTAETLATDMSTLREHLNLCRGLQGRLFRLQCAAETLNGFVASRFVTTLGVATLFIGIASLVW